MLKTVVITGAAGVLGSDLVRKFTADPAVTVYALSSNPARFPAEFCAAPNIRICSNDDLFDGKIPRNTSRFAQLHTAGGMRLCKTLAFLVFFSSNRRKCISAKSTIFCDRAENKRNTGAKLLLFVFRDGIIEKN